MIKYFLILNDCNGTQYGIGTYIRHLLGGLRKLNYSLSIIEMSAKVSEFTLCESQQGIHTYRILAIHIDNGLYCRIASYFIKHSIPRFPKMIFHFNFAHHEPLMHYIRDYYRDCRIIFTVHYLAWCFELNGNYVEFKRIIKSHRIVNQKYTNVVSLFNLEKCAFKSSDEIIVLSEKTRIVLIDDYGIPQDKVHLIRNGLSGKTYNKVKRLNIPKGDLSILFVGRLDEQKGLTIVINAFKMVADCLSAIKLYIVGNGDFNKFLPLCDGFRDRIIFTGRLSQKNLNKLYESADLGVLPSFHEQSSYAVIEMLKFGIPLITSDRMESFIDNPECMVSIPYRNKINISTISKELSEKMLVILSDKSKRSALSNKMKRIFKRYYTRYHMISFFKEMVDRSFNRFGYIVPRDYLDVLDKKMFSIILNRPEIDLKFYGLGGICVYLWYRIKNLKRIKDRCSKEQLRNLEKNLLDCINWIEDLLYQSEDNVEICAQLPFVLNEMVEHYFYQARITKVLCKIPCRSSEFSYISENNIIENALKIYITIF